MKNTVVWCADCGSRLGTIRNNVYALITIVQTQNGVHTEEKTQALCLRCAKERLKDRMHREYVISKQRLE